MMLLNLLIMLIQINLIINSIMMKVIEYVFIAFIFYRLMAKIFDMIRLAIFHSLFMHSRCLTSFGN